MQTGFPRWIVGMGLTCYGTTHLARKAVAIQNISAGFFGNFTGKSRLWFRCFQQILARLQVSAVIVGEDEWARKNARSLLRAPGVREEEVFMRLVMSGAGRLQLLWLVQCAAQRHGRQVGEKHCQLGGS